MQAKVSEPVVLVCTVRVSFVGHGAVGRSLALALRDAGVEIAAVGLRKESPNCETAEADGFAVCAPGEVDLDVDLVVIAVPDSAVAETARDQAGRDAASSGMNPRGGGARATVGSATEQPPVVMHLSGRYGLAPLEPLARRGWGLLAWHPMQTFPADAGAERFRGIWAGVTADERGWLMAETLCDLLGVSCRCVEEGDRARYHHAAVFASNFLPLLFTAGAGRLEGIASSEEEAVAMLLPLVKGMVESVGELDLIRAFTGPVVRDEPDALSEHLEGESDSTRRRLYIELTRALVEYAGGHGLLTPERVRAWNRELERLH